MRAVDGLNLRMDGGQIYGLLGPNGSGKSTTIKLVLGLLKPTAGECAIFGVPSSRAEARTDVGYLPESPYFYGYLSGRELVTFYGRICGMSGRALGSRVDEVIAAVGLADAADRRVGGYSKGMLQRIGLAQAIVHNPRLVILDEPTAGVDAMGTAAITALILQLKSEGKSVVITSHLFAQMEEICDRVAILDRGRLVFEGPMAQLLGRAGRQAIVMETLPADELEALRTWLAARGRKIEEIQQPRSRLDRAFFEAVGRHVDKP
ncbi:MAG: hypothetical protein RIQ93_3363 [Verrucomicrobiota bacterium]